MLEKLYHYTQIFALLLICAYGMSLLAKYGWFFDLYSHFTIQYAIGGIVLGLAFTFYRKFIYAAVMFCIWGLNVYEIQAVYSNPWQVQSPYHNKSPDITVVQFNKLFGNQEWGQIESWMKEHHEQVDLLFVQESGVRTLYKLQEYKKYFPHQFPKGHKQRFNDVSILSRFPFEAEEIPSIGVNGHMPGVKIIYQRPDMAESVHVYSIHTQVPFGKAYYDERSEDLLVIEQAIKADDHPHKIFLGDLNLTPYSPVFKSLVDETGLQFNDYSFFPKVTWNSAFYFPFLKIPIDHILYSPSLKQIDKRVAPSLGSDHHMLIGEFYIPKKKSREK